jgi:PLP dependent protein
MSIASNLAEIRERIAAAAGRAKREPGEIALMAVSKMQPASAIVEAMAAGQRLFGENRVQEFAVKAEHLGIETPGREKLGREKLGREKLGRVGAQLLRSSGRSESGARFHLIGHLQSNKAARAVELFDAIDSVDSLRLAERLNILWLNQVGLNQAAARTGRRLDVLIEINIAGEAAKSGLDPNSPELQELLDKQMQFSGLAIRGFMAVPPFTEETEGARPYFRRLREMRDRLRAVSGLELPELSMGMSHDFEVAIEEGSTCVRVGTAIFGPRPHPAADEEPG